MKDQSDARKELEKDLAPIMSSYGQHFRTPLLASDLAKLGYRKQIKAEWKSGTKNGQYGYYCTNCEAGFTGENAEWIAKEHDFCPKCGARMKGGAE